MSRYFFTVHDGRSYPDLQGTVLPDIDAARVEAVRFAGAILNHEGHNFWDGQNWTMDVSDSSGLLFTLDFAAKTAPNAVATPYRGLGKPSD